VVVPREGSAVLSLDELREWAGDRLAPYKLPTRLLVLAELPRNPLGKVTKPDLVARFPGEPAVSRAAAPAAPGEDRQEER
jgi:malonyl-CoA/methylmalonyl-CoA synthetase